MTPQRPGGASGGVSALPEAPSRAGTSGDLEKRYPPPYGPADLYVVELKSDSQPTSITALLRDGATVGVMTLLDAVLIRRCPDGSGEAIETYDFADDLGMAGVMPRIPGLVRREGYLLRAGSLPEGSSWLVILMENSWARNLLAAVDAADAELVGVERFAPGP